MPIVLLNMLIAIMGDSYELIQDRSLRESVMMKARVLLEIELFMSEADKSNHTFFPKFLHVIVPEGEAKAGPSEYQGLMNALKRKMDEGTSETQDSIAKTQDSISQMKKETQDSIAKTQDSISQMKKEFQVQLADAQKEMQKLQGQLAEIMQILRSRPSA